MDPFSLAWLFWWFDRLKGSLEDYVAEQVDEVADGEVDLGALIAAMYAHIRVYSYLAWLGELGFLRANAEDAGISLAWEPSMPGLSPQAFNDAVRQVVRVGPDKRVHGNRRQIVDRLARRLSDISIEMVARETVLRAMNREHGEMVGWQRYAGANGHPIARFYVEANDPDTHVGRAVAADKRLGALVDEGFSTYAGAFSQELDKDLSELNARFDAEAAGRVQDSVELAEQFFMLSRRGKSTRVGRFLAYAVVPTGTFTCPFCLMQASRGAIFSVNSFNSKAWSAFAAKNSDYAAKWGIHPGCDCKFVPVYVGQTRYAGREIVDAAETLWKKNTEAHTLKGFTKWLSSPEGKAMLDEHMPFVMSADSAARRRARRKAGLE